MRIYHFSIALFLCSSVAGISLANDHSAKFDGTCEYVIQQWLEDKDNPRGYTLKRNNDVTLDVMATNTNVIPAPNANGGPFPVPITTLSGPTSQGKLFFQNEGAYGCRVTAHGASPLAVLKHRAKKAKVKVE